MKRYQIPIMLALVVIMTQIPIWSNPHLFLSRGNDLENFFWPIFILYKKSLVSGHGLPLWNPLWFGGQPLISDPQSLLIYPGQILLLLFPLESAVLLIWFVHAGISSLFAYKVARNLFSSRVSVVIAALYLLSSRLAAAIEAGHFGIILAWTWIPVALFFIQKLAQKVSFKYTVLLGISISLLLQSHTITATIIVPFISLYGFWISSQKKGMIISILLAGIISLGLTAPVLLPQITWQSFTTRYLLLSRPEIFPVWNSRMEFLRQLFPELTRTVSFNTEKVIGLGLVSSLLAIHGWVQLKFRTQLILSGIVFLIFVITLNNVSPIGQLIAQAPVIQMMRVVTRMWPIVILIVLFLVGVSLQKVKNFRVFCVLSSLCLANGYFIYVAVLGKVPNITSSTMQNVYKYISQDKDVFRVYCTDRCIRQKDAALNNIEMIDGYATLTQTNYYKKSWSLFGGYWDYYTLAIPPFGIGESGKLMPDFDSLGEMNVKYVVSPVEIKSKDLVLEQKDLQHYIYLNKQYRPRVFVTDDSRKIVRNVNFTMEGSDQILIQEVKPHEYITFSAIYSPGWHIDGRGLTEDASNMMTVQNTTETARLTYRPDSFVYGVAIFFITVFLLFCGYLRNKRVFSRISKIVQRSRVS